MSITPHEQPAGEFGLLANGASGRWDVALDEHHEREEWSLEFDGPNVYLAFSIPDLGVIGRTIEFLQRHLSRPIGGHPPKWTQQDDEIRLGTLGLAELSLLWDEEDVRRCVILVKPEGAGAIRLCLQRDDIEMLLEALRQVADALPQEAK